MFQLADGTRLSYQFTPDRASSEREPDEHEPLVSISGTGIAGDPVAVELSFHGRRGEARRIKALHVGFLWWADLLGQAAHRPAASNGSAAAAEPSAARSAPHVAR
jgi:hypothetical protein